MKVYQRYLAREIYSAVTLVLVAFLMLFAFFDFINELQSLGKGNYQLSGC
jgi:lipopolysaccharide export system permease protein